VKAKKVLNFCKNPISETLCFVNILDKDETMDNVQERDMSIYLVLTFRVSLVDNI
jgi:hypothetical protein